MFHFFESITNTRGDSLVGYQVALRVPGTGAPVSIYADQNGTPIVAVSGISNVGLTSNAGNADLYVPFGEYDVIVSTPAGSQLLVIPRVPMNGGATGPAGKDGDPGAGGNVAKGRGKDPAGLRGPVAASASPGDAWQLSEDGRDGLFKMRAGTPPVADPNEGLYVVLSPTRYWERVITDNVVEMSWFGTSTTRGDNQVPHNAALALAPNGSTVLYPPPGDYTISAPLFMQRDNIKIVGRKRASRFVVNQTLAKPGQNEQALNGFVLGGKNIELDSICLYGVPSNKSSGNAYGTIITGENGAAGTVTENVSMHDCIIENFSVPVIAFAHPEATSGRAKRTRNVRVFDNTMTCNVQAFASFGVEDIDVHGNRIEWFEALAANNSSNTVVYGFRILGTVRGRFHHNTIIGGLKGTAHAGYDAVKLDPAALGSPPANGPQTGNLLSNRDVQIEDNTFIDFYSGPAIIECRGVLSVKRNRFTCGDLNNTYPDNISASVDGDGTQNNGIIYITDDAVFAENTFEGFSIGFKYAGGEGRLRFNGNTVVSNMASDRPAVLAVATQGAETVDIMNNDFIGMPGGRIAGAAGKIVTVVGNRFGEAQGDANISTPLDGIGIGAEGGATFIGRENRRFAYGMRDKLVLYRNLQPELG